MASETLNFDHLQDIRDSDGQENGKKKMEKDISRHHVINKHQKTQDIKMS